MFCFPSYIYSLIQSWKEQDIVSSKSSFDVCGFLITWHCSCLPNIKLWLAGFVIYLIHSLHVMNGQGLQLSCWIPKSGNCGDYKNKTCNFRHPNTEIHEENYRLISTLLWVSSYLLAVTSASAYKLEIKVTKITSCLKTWLIKLLKLCYASDLFLATVFPL